MFKYTPIHCMNVALKDNTSRVATCLSSESAISFSLKRSFSRNQTGNDSYSEI